MMCLSATLGILAATTVPVILANSALLAAKGQLLALVYFAIFGTF